MTSPSGALPRDFIDIAAALDRYSRRQLLELAFTRDSGLRAADAALAAQHLDRLHDDQFLPYQLTGEKVSVLRERFASWPRDAVGDDEARAAHEAVHRPPATATERVSAGFPTPISAALQQSTPPHASPPAPPGLRSAPRSSGRLPTPRHPTSVACQAAAC